MSNDSVCLTIQRLLETKLVHFLQHLRHFVLQLVPNNVCDLTGDSEEDAFAKHLAERIYEKFTCKDFQHSAVDDSGTEFNICRNSFSINIYVQYKTCINFYMFQSIEFR